MHGVQRTTPPPERYPRICEQHVRHFSHRQIAFCGFRSADLARLPRASLADGPPPLLTPPRLNHLHHHQPPQYGYIATFYLYPARAYVEYEECAYVVWRCSVPSRLPLRLRGSVCSVYVYVCVCVCLCAKVGGCARITELTVTTTARNIYTVPRARPAERGAGGPAQNSERPYGGGRGSVLRAVGA